MYNELLKQHEEILKKLTDKATKETDFNERGQFINIQKMIENELEAIIDLNRIYKESDSNKLCAYKLGVGKILIGQRGSGISSTLIDECLKYNRPLIVERKSRAEQLAKQYTELKVAWLIDDGNYFESNKEIKWCDEQVNVDLFTCRNNVNTLTKMIDKIKSRVGAIGTVGISYELDEQQPIWVPRNSEIPKVKENVIKESFNKYVYVYADHLGDTEFKMVYFSNFEDCDMITITNVRIFKSIDDVSDALFVAKSIGYKPIINKINCGLMFLAVLGNNSKEFIYVQENRGNYSNAYTRFVNGDIIINFQSKEAQDAINSFDEKCLLIDNGYLKYVPKVEDDNSSLLKEIILAIHLIKEDNK